MRALHVVGVDHQFRLREDLGAVFKQQSLMMLARVGLLRCALDDNFALEHTSPALARHALNQLSSHGARRLVLNHRRQISMTAAICQIYAIEHHLRAFALNEDMRLDTRKLRALSENELPIPGAGLQSHFGEPYPRARFMRIRVDLAYDARHVRA